MWLVQKIVTFFLALIFHLSVKEWDIKKGYFDEKLI